MWVNPGYKSWKTPLKNVDNKLIKAFKMWIRQEIASNVDKSPSYAHWLPQVMHILFLWISLLIS